MSENHEALAGYPLVSRITLLWGDQDSFGHVNNTVYNKWCETARVDYLIRVDAWPPLPPAGIGPILANINVDFRRPLTYPDEVLVGTRVSQIGNSSLRMDHVILSCREGAVAAEATSVLVMLDYASGKTVRVSDEMRRAIEQLEGSAPPAAV